MTLMFDFAPLGLVNLARVLAAGRSGGAQVAAATSALAAVSSTFGEGGAVLLRERSEGQRGTRAACSSLSHSRRSAQRLGERASHCTGVHGQRWACTSSPVAVR